MLHLIIELDIIYYILIRALVTLVKIDLFTSKGIAKCTILHPKSLIITNIQNINTITFIK